MKELNKDIYSMDIQLPTHVDISDKFLIQVEKYMKVLREKYNRDRKALVSKSYFT